MNKDDKFTWKPNHIKKEINGIPKLKEMIKNVDEKHKPGHDKEGKMAKFDAKEAYLDAIDVFKMIDEYDNLPEWLEAKITKASDYLNSVKDYLTHHQNKA